MNQNHSKKIQTNYQIIQEKISLAALSSGRSAESIRLVVVTKSHPIETVKAAIEAGIREFGENYTEEAVIKITEIGKIEKITWHMIGHVQSRKADLVAQYFDYVHTIDSLKLANRLSRFAGQYNRKLPVLIECNSGGEATKFGYPIYDKSQWINVENEARQIAQLPNLDIRGLMTMPPLFDDPEKSRPFFQQLRKFQEYLYNQVSEASWTELSMGASADYVTAVEEGATIVRVGTAILGPRQLEYN